MSDYDGPRGMLNMILEHATPYQSTKCCAGPNGYQEATCQCDEATETLEAMIVEYGDRRVEEALRVRS